MTWFILVATMVTHSGETTQGVIPMPTQKACGDSLPATQEVLLRTYKEVALKCLRTEVARIRPRERPAK